MWMKARKSRSCQSTGGFDMTLCCFFVSFNYHGSWYEVIYTSVLNVDYQQILTYQSSQVYPQVPEAQRMWKRPGTWEMGKVRQGSENQTQVWWGRSPYVSRTHYWNLLWHPWNESWGQAFHDARMAHQAGRSGGYCGWKKQLLSDVKCKILFFKLVLHLKILKMVMRQQ